LPFLNILDQQTKDKGLARVAKLEKVAQQT